MTVEESANVVLSTAHSNYAEMLKIKSPFTPADADLNRLAETMAAEKKKVPAGYTYLSQFINHDISLDSKNDKLPWGEIDPATVTNKRTPFFDLETIYGKDARTAPDEVSRTDLMRTNSLLKLGETAPDVLVDRRFPNDLPRVPGTATAHIVDKRNDENLAVAQTQVAFIKFHNAVAERLGGADSAARFEAARQITTRHYQWLVLHDFLPRIVKKSVLSDVLNGGNKFYLPDSRDVYLPLEYSTAAGRAGHSMVKDSYQWNRLFNSNEKHVSASLSELRAFTGAGKMGGGKFNNLPSLWAINWKWFFDIDDSSFKDGSRFNFAEKINTEIVGSLGHLNNNIKFNRMFSLPALDLYRARALSMPSGQMVAGKILENTPHKPLTSEQIGGLLPDELKKVFSAHTPLWFYLLAEAEINETGQTLGEVGSRIVAETMVKLIELSPYSILKTGWQPGADLPLKNGKFGMPEMLKFIAAQNAEFDELDPLNESFNA